MPRNIDVINLETIVRACMSSEILRVLTSGMSVSRPLGSLLVLKDKRPKKKIVNIEDRLVFGTRLLSHSPYQLLKIIPKLFLFRFEIRD